MADQSLKQDKNKARMDLIPWFDFQSEPAGLSLEDTYIALKAWFFGAPVAFDMRFPRGELVGVATALGFGAEKYAPRAWEAGIPFSRVYAAASRHAEAALSGVHIDAESGLPHASHFWCNVLFLLVFTSRQTPGIDDRPPAHPRVARMLAQAGVTLGAKTPAPGKDN